MPASVRAFYAARLKIRLNFCFLAKKNLETIAVSRLLSGKLHQLRYQRFSWCFQWFQLFGQGFWSLLLHTAGCYCATKKDIVGFMEFGAVCTILSAICTLTAFLFCAVPVINPLALHNEGDWGNAVPRTALRCIKISLIFLALFFQRCHFHPENPSLRIYLDTSTALPSLRTLKISGIGLASSSSVRVRGVYLM